MVESYESTEGTREFIQNSLRELEKSEIKVKSLHNLGERTYLPGVGIDLRLDWIDGGVKKLRVIDDSVQVADDADSDIYQETEDYSEWFNGMAVASIVDPRRVLTHIQNPTLRSGQGLKLLEGAIDPLLFGIDIEQIETANFSRAEALNLVENPKIYERLKDMNDEELKKHLEEQRSESMHIALIFKGESLTPSALTSTNYYLAGTIAHVSGVDAVGYEVSPKIP